MVIVHTEQALTDAANHWSLMFFILALGVGVAYFTLGWSSNTISVVRTIHHSGTSRKCRRRLINVLPLLTSLLRQHIACHYRKEYFESILSKPIAFFDADENSSGTLTARVANDPTQLQQLLGKLSNCYCPYLGVSWTLTHQCFAHEQC